MLEVVPPASRALPFIWRYGRPRRASVYFFARRRADTALDAIAIIGIAVHAHPRDRHVED